MRPLHIEVPVEVLPHGAGLALPAYETDGAAGMDLRAAIEEDLVLAPGERAAVPTGLRLAIPTGFEGQVRPRSGWALRSGVTCINAVGTVDSDYRGELRVPLVNLGTEAVTIERGQRIAQLVFAPVAAGTWVAGRALDATRRGSGGFGHTGSR